MDRDPQYVQTEREAEDRRTHTPPTFKHSRFLKNSHIVVAMATSPLSLRFVAIFSLTHSTSFLEDSKYNYDALRLSLPPTLHHSPLSIPPVFSLFFHSLLWLEGPSLLQVFKVGDRRAGSCCPTIYCRARQLVPFHQSSHAETVYLITMATSKYLHL